MEKTRNVKYTLTPQQDKAFDCLTSNEDCSVLFGGAKGGGKTFLFCLWAFYWCKWLIQFFDIKNISYPLPLGFIGRKRGVDFNKTTLETWKKIVPPQSYEIREQDREIIIENKVKVFFGGLDDETVINKFNSAEFAFFGIDQAEETERGELSVLQASTRLTFGGKTPPYKKFYTANPADCWLREDFIANVRKLFYYVRALPTDNPHLPVNYLQTLDEAFSYDPVLLAAYKEGNWDLLQSHANLITQEALERLKNIFFDKWGRRIVACDPAIGGDECVIYYLEDDEIKDTLILHLNDTQKIGAEVIAFMAKHNCNDFVVDAIGIGKGVADYVSACGRKVIEIISSELAVDKEHFANVRSEIWNYTATKIMRREIPYPEDEKLRRQLCAVKYKQGARRFELVRKDITKKDLGSSPDRADAYVYGIWGLSQIESSTESYTGGINKKRVFSGAAGW